MGRERGGAWPGVVGGLSRSPFLSAGLAGAGWLRSGASRAGSAEPPARRERGGRRRLTSRQSWRGPSSRRWPRHAGRASGRRLKAARGRLPLPPCGSGWAERELDSPQHRGKMFLP
ncbi:unnamed protein product [Caretta caretta]